MFKIILVSLCHSFLVHVFHQVWCICFFMNLRHFRVSNLASYQDFCYFINHSQFDWLYVFINNLRISANSSFHHAKYLFTTFIDNQILVPSSMCIQAKDLIQLLLLISLANYLARSRSMQCALGANNKISFVNGSTQIPDQFDMNRGVESYNNLLMEADVRRSQFSFLKCDSLCFKRLTLRNELCPSVVGCLLLTSRVLGIVVFGFKLTLRNA